MGFIDNIKGFGKRMWSGIKGFGKKVIEGGKTVFKKIGEVAGKVVSPVAKVLSYLPGTMGTIGRVVSGVSDAIKTATNQIPNEKAKEKINQFISKADDTSHKVIGKIEDGGRKVQDFMQRAKTGIDVVKKIPDSMKDAIRNSTN